MTYGNVRRLVVLCRASLEELTPVLSLALALPELGLQTTVVTSRCGGRNRRVLENAGSQIVETDRMEAYGPWEKGQRLRDFFHAAWSAIDASGNEALLWVASGDTAIALGGALARRRYVLQLHELYDQNPVYRTLIGWFARRARAVVVPEHCRSAIVRTWYKLPTTPFVVPNKPYYHPRRRGLEVADQAARQVLEEVGDKRILLYQGDIGPLRDLRPVARATNALGPGWQFLLLGKDTTGFFESIRRVNHSALHIPRIDPPGHLAVTSRAHIGLAVYGYDMLNAIFCAPNKIWEYAGFGVPMLCQDLPGLRFTVGQAGAGACVDLSDESGITTAIAAIDSNYDLYRSAAERFFDSVRIPGLLAEILTRSVADVS